MSAETDILIQRAAAELRTAGAREIYVFGSAAKGTGGSCFRSRLGGFRPAGPSPVTSARRMNLSGWYKFRKQQATEREQWKRRLLAIHPLCVALDKLQTLDLVRIIEGHA